MSKLNLPAHILELNPWLGKRDQKLARLGGDNYKSELERRCANQWMFKMFEPGWQYESIRLRIPGDAWYTPDFYGVLSYYHEGHMAFVETKGYTKSLRADKLRYNAAMEIYNYFDWCWLEFIDGQWVDKWNEKA